MSFEFPLKRNGESRISFLKRKGFLVKPFEKKGSPFNSALKRKGGGGNKGFPLKREAFLSIPF